LKKQTARADKVRTGESLILKIQIDISARTERIPARQCAQAGKEDIPLSLEFRGFAAIMIILFSLILD
jgi:hypothetical protein